MKKCNTCKTDKSLDNFYSQKKKKTDGVEYIYHRPDCKECAKLQAAKWNEENREIAIISRKKYRKSEKGRVANQRAHKNRRDNGKYYTWLKKSGNKYSKFNKHHKITDKEWESCKLYFNYECAYCGKTEENHRGKYNQQLNKEHVDHVGDNDLSNCIPACKPCNSSKGTFELEYWYKERSFDYSEVRYSKIIQWLENDYKNYIE